MAVHTGIQLARREDLTADCESCFGLCCVTLAFARSADFAIDKPAGEPCTHLDAADRCDIHPHLRERGFKGCTVFDCFGAGQKVSRSTFEGRSWRDDAQARVAMSTVFPVVRRLHELLWYLHEAVARVSARRGEAVPWTEAFARVRSLSDADPGLLAALDVDAEYDAARPLLLEASELARHGTRPPDAIDPDPAPGPGLDLLGARLRAADLRGLTLRGSRLIAADLRDARLSHCDVLGVDLRDADVSGADLAEAIYLTPMQVNSARGDARTMLPPGFTRPTHWRAS